MKTALFSSLLFGLVSTPVHNDRVTVAEAIIQPGAIETSSGAYPSVIVYLTDGSVEISTAAGKAVQSRVKRGESIFQAAAPATITNTGSAAVSLARIQFLGKGLPETWGTAGLSPNYKLLLENRYTRVYDIRIPAGTREPQHTHHDRVVVCLSGAELKHLMPDGREEPSTLKTGEIVWRRGGTHIGQNLGKTDLWVIAVEPK